MGYCNSVHDSASGACLALIKSDFSIQFSIEFYIIAMDKSRIIAAEILLFCGANMSYEDKDEDRRLVLGIVAGIVTLLIGGVVGLGIWMSGNGATGTAGAGKTATPAVNAHASATGAVTTAGSQSNDDAKIVVENGVVKFYFATGKADLAKGANEALAEVVKGVKAGQKAVVSGYHDSTGNLANNQELAKQRATSVRDTLVALGVSADSIELKKPENATGTGNDAEARRVEVVLAK